MYQHGFHVAFFRRKKYILEATLNAYLNNIYPINIHSHSAYSKWHEGKQFKNKNGNILELLSTKEDCKTQIENRVFVLKGTLFYCKMHIALQNRSCTIGMCNLLKAKDIQLFEVHAPTIGQAKMDNIGIPRTLNEYDNSPH